MLLPGGGALKAEGLKTSGESRERGVSMRGGLNTPLSLGGGGSGGPPPENFLKSMSLRMHFKPF